MAIYPRFDNSTNIATPNTPAAPTDPSGPQIEAAGQAITKGALQSKEIWQKRQDLIDEAQVTDRYLNVVGDLEMHAENMQKPEVALPVNGQGGARQYMEKVLSDAQPEWYKGLSPRAQKHLQHKLAPKILEYKIGAARAENRALGDFSEAQGVRLKEAFIDRFSRGVATNEKGEIVDDDGAKSEEFSFLSGHIDEQVRLGYKKMAEGEKEKEAALTTASYYRANKLVQSESEADLVQYQKTWQQENEQAGSTYLRRVDANKRDDLNRTAHIRQTEMREKQEREAKKKLTEESNAFSSRVIRSFNSQDPKDRMSDAQIQQGLTAYESVMPHETVTSLLKLKDESWRAGGVTDPDTFHRVRIDILAGEKPVTTNQILRNVPDKLSAKDAEALIQLNDKQMAEPGVEKTAFYKAGKEQLKLRILGNATMLPGMEWMIKPADATKYSDALYQFNQYARKAFQKGEGVEDLEAYARKLADSLKAPKPGEDNGAAKQPGDNPQPQKKTEKAGAKPAYAR